MDEIKRKNGFVLLARAVLDSPIWHDTPDMLKVFLYLLLKARHNKKPKRYPDFDVKRGDLVTSLAEITEENQWYEQKAVRQWSRAKVARMLAKLKHDDRIEVIPDTYGTHVRICNYESYQDPQVYKADKTGQQRDNSETTVRQQ